MTATKTNWPLLKKGDIVDVIAPGYLKNLSEIKAAKIFLEKFGLVARIPEDLTGNDYLHSNTDEVRAKHLTDAILNETSKVIWCLRGGYGCSKLVESLTKITRPEKSKLLIGYSDVTFLHIFFNQQWDWPSLHASVLAEVATDLVSEETIEDLMSILFGKTSEVTFNDMVSLNADAKLSEVIEGKVIGGNLTVSQTTLGTKWQINGEGNILFFEDINEDAYRIDRMLQQFLQAGIFTKAKAVLFGEFANKEKQGEEILIKLIIKKFANKLKTPAFYIKNIGHESPNNPLPLGKMAILKSQERVTLTVPNITPLKLLK